MISTRLPRCIQLDGAAEVVRAPSLTDGWPAEAIRVEYEDAPWTLPAALAQLQTAWERRNAGQRSDPKLAIRELRLGDDGTLNCRLQPTEWREVRPLDEAPGAHARFERRPNGGVMLLPNTAVVHVVAATTDGQLLAFRRSLASHYHPGAWSVTYEEGLAPEDGHGSDLFQRAARRGVAEELTADGADFSLDAFRVVSVIAEQPLDNLAVVVMAELPVATAELPVTRPSDELDVGVGVTIPVDRRVLVAALTSASAGPAIPHGPWHPTARYRMLMALAHFFGEDAAASALSATRRT